MKREVISAFSPSDENGNHHDALGDVVVTNLSTGANNRSSLQHGIVYFAPGLLSDLSVEISEYCILIPLYGYTGIVLRIVHYLRELIISPPHVLK
jgi:hypothetical protein